MSVNHFLVVPKQPAVMEKANMMFLLKEAILKKIVASRLN